MAENSDGRARGPGRPFQAGQSGNPGGRTPKTDDERAAELFLRDKTLAAAQRLVQLQSSDDEKIALGATLGHLKITIGTLERQAGPNGEAVAHPLASWPPEKLEALAAAQLEKQRAEKEAEK